MAQSLIIDKYDIQEGSNEDMDHYVLKKYQQSIDYYWMASGNNKRSYKRFKSFSLVVSALLTVVSAISGSEYISQNVVLSPVFAMATPALAAFLMVIIGFSQNFQWGANWREMVMSAERLQRERDRFLSTDLKNRDYQQELKIINEMILEETQAFFQRTGM